MTSETHSVSAEEALRTPMGFLASVQNRSSRCCHFKQKQATRDPPPPPPSLRAPLPVSENPSEGLANKWILRRAGRQALGALCLLPLKLVSPCCRDSLSTRLRQGAREKGCGGVNITVARGKEEQKREESKSSFIYGTCTLA